MRFFLGILIASFLCLSAHANENTANAKAAQSIIDQQINAFLKDDAASAYSFADPGIKSIFPTPDAFIAMVKRLYAPIYRPQTYRFAKTIEQEGTLVQSVLIKAQDGGSFEALYTLVKQSDGSWKIVAVALQQLPGIDT